MALCVLQRWKDSIKFMVFTLVVDSSIYAAGRDFLLEQPTCGDGLMVHLFYPHVGNFTLKF